MQYFFLDIRFRDESYLHKTDVLSFSEIWILAWFENLSAHHHIFLQFIRFTGENEFFVSIRNINAL